jgi:hypothetical protein
MNRTPTRRLTNRRRPERVASYPEAPVLTVLTVDYGYLRFWVVDARGHCVAAFAEQTRATACATMMSARE